MKRLQLLFAMLLISCFAFPQAGILDLNFGDNGIVATGWNNQDAVGFSIALDPNEKIVIAGTLAKVYDGPNSIGITRYNSDGSPDISFNTNGKLKIDYSELTDESINDMVVQPDGKIVTAGTANGTISSDDAFFLTRFNADGSADLSFNSIGYVLTSIDGHPSKALSVLLQQDGKILLGGGVQDDMLVYNFCLIRYNSDGSLDATFDTDGIAVTNLSIHDFTISDLALQQDGKILAVGSCFCAPLESDLAIVRYNSDGSLDATFDNDGILITTMGQDVESTGLTMLPDDKILIAGNFNDNSNEDGLFLMKYNSDGLIDASFGTAGIVTSGNNVYCSAVLSQSDGKIITCGSLGGDVALMRFNQNGAIDNTFGTMGLATLDFYGDTDRANDMILQPDGKLVTAGSAYKNSTADVFSAARFLMDLGTGNASINDLDGQQTIYPNPVFAQATFEYQIPESSNATLLLKDITGKTMRTFFSEYKNTGRHTEKLNLEGIPSGVYMLELNANYKSVSTKVIRE